MSISAALIFGFLISIAGSFATAAEPLVLGRGLDRFEVGPLLHKDDFENLDRWVVQIEKKEGFPEPWVKSENNTLDCLIPGRGCTIWFKEKLKTRLSISYQVVCPEPAEGMPGVEARDVNNFWLASDPVDSEKGLFDPERYNGSFSSYHKMNGYYASTGGGRNTTTRMRRYPRGTGWPLENPHCPHGAGQSEGLSHHPRQGDEGAVGGL